MSERVERWGRFDQGGPKRFTRVGPEAKFEDDGARGMAPVPHDQLRRRRVRLYPRSLQVLQRLSGPGALLKWDEESGKYKIEGGRLRKDTVIPRSLEKLIQAQAVRRGAGDPPSFALSAVGRKLLLKSHLEVLSRAEAKAKVSE